MKHEKKDGMHVILVDDKGWATMQATKEALSACAEMIKTQKEYIDYLAAVREMLKTAWDGEKWVFPPGTAEKAPILKANMNAALDRLNRLPAEFDPHLLP